MDTLADKYYLKAVDSYPYDLEEVVESLKYALSYDNEHVGANYLMGKIYAEQLHNYDEAESYYQIAMAADPRNETVCLDYVLLLITMKEFGKAEKLIGYTRSLKGVDLARVYHREGLIQEYQYAYDKAIQLYEKATLDCYNEEFSGYLDATLRRVKAKQKLKKKTSSGK
jgi:tetratricopeptide (TPR) repeat protein